MNRYTTQFHGVCPNNGARVSYHLEVETQETVYVESLLEHCEAATHDPVYHEVLAKELLQRLVDDFDDGAVFKLRLRAHHHGVDIETVLP